MAKEHETLSGETMPPGATLIVTNMGVCCDRCGWKLKTFDIEEWATKNCPDCGRGPVISPLELREYLEMMSRRDIRLQPGAERTLLDGEVQFYHVTERDGRLEHIRVPESLMPKEEESSWPKK